LKVHDLVLLGGGHTHVLLIKALAMRPIDSVRVTLVSEKALTPYSGMLPGFVAGHYSLEQTNIDLNKLCRKAGVRWINARATNIDPVQKHISLQAQAGVDFDVLSIDIGSTPDQGVTGANEFTTGVKPIVGFQQQWGELLESSKLQQGSSSSELNWGVVGAGAGGVELVMAMAYRLRAIPHLKFHIIFRGPSVLDGYPKKVIKTIERKLKQLKVSLHPNFSVAEVTINGVYSANNKHIEIDKCIWCTGAIGAPWLAESPLETSPKNFVLVNEYLQSTSHSHVFAVGDIAEMVHDPRPKAGVFAVRQAPELEANLRHYFANKPLQKINLQSEFLSLLALGEKSAVASRNGLTVSGRWVWRWKDSIDQKFMDQFSNLPMLMPSIATEKQSNEEMHCAGCASKLGPDVLIGNLKHVNGSNDTRLEDAHLWEAKVDHSLVQSIDGFRSFTSDEYLFAKICVNHALSDINAMGALPTHAQCWINLSFNHERLQQRDHLRLLKAISNSLRQQGAKLSGGHSSEGFETHVAIVANGEVAQGKHWSKRGAQAGDVLLLSKSLGTGVVLAADMQAAADADAVDAAYESMLDSNYIAAQQLLAVTPSAVTDVTGFGLLGHLLEMLDGASTELDQNLCAEISLDDIPFISGAQALAKAGWRSSLYPQLENYLNRCRYSEHLSSHQLELLLDPQTSGGLLASVSSSNARALLENSDEFVMIGKLDVVAETADNKPFIKIQ